MSRRSTFSHARLGALILLAAAACSSSSNSSGAGGDDGGNGNGDGGNGDGPGAGSGNGDGGGFSFGDGGGFSFPTGGGGDLPPGCSNVEVRGERLPLELMLMMDTSASMEAKTSDTGPKKWDAVRSAMNAFFADGSSAGIGVGLQFFPRFGSTDEKLKQCYNDAACGTFGPCYGIKACSAAPGIQLCNADAECGPTGGSCAPFGYCKAANDFCKPVGSPCAGGADTCVAEVYGYCIGRDSCIVADYATPAAPIAQLPGGAGALMSLIADKKPDGYTPTAAALSGAIEYAKSRVRANPDARVTVVLATDGLPTTCEPKDIGGVAAIAQKAATEAPAIKTFVVGVFSQNQQGAAANLHQIAQAGGTGQAHLVDTQNLSTTFLDALNAIRTASVSCEIKIPAATTQMPINYGNVNVRFTGTSGTQIGIGYVGSADKCHPRFGGWYYDVDPAKGTPTKIVTCEETCKLLRSDNTGRVDILVGCKTIYVE